MVQAPCRDLLKPSTLLAGVLSSLVLEVDKKYSLNRETFPSEDERERHRWRRQHQHGPSKRSIRQILIKGLWGREEICSNLTWFNISYSWISWLFTHPRAGGQIPCWRCFLPSSRTHSCNTFFLEIMCHIIYEDFGYRVVFRYYATAKGSD